MDSDSVYLVGADPTGLRFRLVVNEEAFEDDLPPQEIEEAADWARDHAPRAPSPAELREVLRRSYVFAEEGLDVVFARMGLLPADAEGAVVDAKLEDERGAAEETARVAALGDLGDHTPDPERLLEDDRWYAPVTGFRARESETWWLVVAQGEFHPEAAQRGIGRVLARILIREPEAWRTTVAFLCRSGERTRMLDPFFEGRDDLEHELRGRWFNLDVGDWQRVPDEVPRDLAATVDWVTSRPGS